MIVCRVDRRSSLIATRSSSPSAASSHRFEGRQEHLDPHPGRDPRELGRHDVPFDQVTLEELRVGRDDLVPLAQGTARGEALPVVLREHEHHHPERVRDVGRSQELLHQGCTQVVRVGEQDLALVGEAAEERAVGDPGPPCDLDDAGVLER